MNKYKTSTSEAILKSKNNFSHHRNDSIHKERIPSDPSDAVQSSNIHKEPTSSDLSDAVQSSESLEDECEEEYPPSLVEPPLPIQSQITDGSTIGGWRVFNPCPSIACEVLDLAISPPSNVEENSRSLDYLDLAGEPNYDISYTM